MSSTSIEKRIIMSKSLSVVKRESFFDDSFFEDSWGDFEKAIQNILNKFHSEKLTIDVNNRNNCTDVYRRIRTSNIEKDLYQSQALQVTEKDGKFQCVMDVKDFTPNDLQVKVVDDRVVVDGKFEKKSEDGSSMVSKSFHKEFTLPSNADIENVATALSRDGVLTIRVPKKEGASAPPSSGAVQQASTVSQSLQETSSSKVGDSSSSVTQQSSSVKSYSSTTSSSKVSSTKKVSSSTTSSSNVSSSSVGTDDMSKDMQDRLVFTHDSVNIKLPEK